MREGEVRECCGVWLYILSGCLTCCLAWLISEVLAGHMAVDKTSADLSVQRWKGHWFICPYTVQSPLVTQPPHIIDVKMSASRASQEVKAEFGREC